MYNVTIHCIMGGVCMARSFHNKILRVNLTKGTIAVEEPGLVYMRKYMGGWNVIADVLLREVPQGADPLGPANKLVFAAGVLTGLAASGMSRSTVGAKSPLTGGFGASEGGGHVPSEFKRAGFDAIIFEGVSPKPVYLWVHDGEAELRDAGHLWGQTTKETLTALQSELGEKRLGAAMIGPGGENQVLFSCIMNELKDAAGRTGLGAVMGSKNIKAVVARGTMKLDGAKPEVVSELARSMARSVAAGERAAGMHKWGTGGNLTDSSVTGNLPIRNFRDGLFEEGAWNLSSEKYMPEIGLGMEGCTACAVRCKKVVRAEGVDPDYGGPEYETAGALGSTCGIGDVVAVSRGSALCNALGIDTIATGVSIAFAMEAFERGMLTLEDTEGIDLRFGNADAMLACIEKIAYQEGFGKFLALGSARMAEELGGDAYTFAMTTKKQEFPMHEPRFKRGMAIGYALSPTGADHMHALHDAGLGTATEDGFMPNGLLRELGVLEPLPLEDLGPNKVRATYLNSLHCAMRNVLPCCHFVPWSMDEYVQLVRGATGFDVSTYELIKLGERAWTLARVFNMREGWTVDDDRLPERSYGPTTDGALEDGGIDREELEEAVHTYYAMAGWDPETGVPTLAKLQELGVEWAAAYLPR
jgi:aldehyde:ferredoxin oxidoreductase